MITAAEQEALRTGEVTRSTVAAEVEALEARRSALSDDVDALSGHVTAQRERLASTVPPSTRRSSKPEACRTSPAGARRRRPTRPAAGAGAADRARTPSRPTELMAPTRAARGAPAPARDADRAARAQAPDGASAGPDHPGGADGRARPSRRRGRSSTRARGATTAGSADAPHRGPTYSRPDRLPVGQDRPVAWPVRWPIPPSTRNRRSPPWRRRSSPSGRATRPSRPRSSSAPPGAERRQRVRLLRRPAVRQRPAPLRPPAHRLRQGRRAPLPDHAGPPGRAPLRLGLPRPAGRGGGREASSGSPARPEILELRRRPVQRGLPRRRCCATPSEWERYVTRQARWVDFANDYKTLDLAYMESVMWAFKTALGQGPGLRGLPGARRTAGGARRRCQQHRDPDGRRLPRPPGPGAHRVVRAGADGGRASDPRPGRPRRGRCRRTWPSPSVRTSTTRCWRRTAQRYVLAEARLGALRAGARRRRRGSARSRAPSWSAAATRRCSRSSPTSPNAFRVLAADFVTTEDGTGVVHLAPGFGEDDQPLCNANGIPTGRARRRRTAAFTAEVAAVRRACRSSRPTRRSSATLKDARRRGPPRHLRPHLPALLALRHAARLQGGVVLVRAR